MSDDWVHMSTMSDAELKRAGDEAAVQLRLHLDEIMKLSLVRAAVLLEIGRRERAKKN